MATKKKTEAFIQEECFKIRIQLLDKFLGTIPKDPTIYKTYIASKIAPKEVKNAEGLPVMEEPSSDYLSEIADADSAIESLEEKGWTGFFRDDNGLYILNYMVMGFLRESANNLKDQIGITGLRSKVTKYVFVGPRKIYLGKDEADGCLERPLRANTPKGTITALSRSDYISEGTELEFHVSILKNKEVKPKLVEGLFEYGKYSGLGQFRNGSYGRFQVLEFKKVDDSLDIDTY